MLPCVANHLHTDNEEDFAYAEMRMLEVYNVRINKLQCHRLPQALSYTSFSIPHSDLERRRN